MKDVEEFRHIYPKIPVEQIRHIWGAGYEQGRLDTKKQYETPKSAEVPPQPQPHREQK